MRIWIKRNDKHFGPYPPDLLQQYLKDGALLPQDYARREDDLSDNWLALSDLLKSGDVGVDWPGTGNPITEALVSIGAIDRKLIFPGSEITSLRWLVDRRLVSIAAIGLAPIAALVLLPGVRLGYWAIALYFSTLWAMFFYYLFRTPQIRLSYCFLCFLFTAVVSISVLLILPLVPPWSVLYAFAGSKDPLIRFLGMLFGVGLHEELCKAAILFWLVRRPGNLLMPQTVVFYGMLSGLGFGIHEGLVYQQTVNREQGVDVAYFLNVARLTSLPFLHAIWTGIAAYFIAFSSLVPKKRYGLWVVAISIPAFLHAMYDTTGPNILGLSVALLSVILLMTYLSHAQAMHRSLDIKS